MPIKRVKIDDYEPECSGWIIEGFISSNLSLWSGEPKMGKSMLAGHAAYSLINRTQFLGQSPIGENHIIGWMGFDPGWKDELSARWKGKTKNSISLYEPLRDMKKAEWLELAKELKEDGVTVFVIDHLYGLAGSALLNDANEVYKVFDLLRPIYENYGIAVVLIHQAGKGFNNKGRAANSVAIEGEARCLVRISEKRKPNIRKIELVSNQGELSDFKIALDPEVCKVVATPNSQPKNDYQREAPRKVEEFFKNAKPEELNRGWKGAGRCLYRIGISSTEGGGRTMARNWGKQSLLAKDEFGSITPGANYEAWLANKAQGAA